MPDRGFQEEVILMNEILVCMSHFFSYRLYKNKLIFQTFFHIEQNIKEKIGEWLIVKLMESIINITSVLITTQNWKSFLLYNFHDITIISDQSRPFQSLVNTGGFIKKLYNTCLSKSCMLLSRREHFL